MGTRAPLVLLDDARGAADALAYRAPVRTFVARMPGEVDGVLAAADAARRERGLPLAGYVAYEAGLALEPRLAPRAARRSGGTGPLVWLGLFEEPERIAPADVAGWLAAHADADAGPATLGPLDPQVSQGAYEAAFAELSEAIAAGDIYQANLTLPLAGGFTGDPIALYGKLRATAQAGYGGLVFDGHHWLASLSPELFVTAKGRSLRTRPMKGTRPRSDDPAIDAALREELAASVKDRAENRMIVDLLRNDLSRIAEAGSVDVTEAFVVETYPTVHQMVSTVSARLGEGMGPMDVLRALFPCGSITGAPKIRAMELIDAAERDARGPYCGAIGRIDAPKGAHEGDCAFNVAIRTLRLTEMENGRGKASLGVGGAIVADSDPHAEWRETTVKGAFARCAERDGAARFDLIETMLFTPQDGIALLERHLERAKASAAALGTVFDRHEARNAIHALCFDLDTPHKVRLQVARGGAIALEATRHGAQEGDPVRCIALPLPVAQTDWRLRHKTSERGFYADALEAAGITGAADAVFVRPDGLVTESAIANVFVERGGTLVTPPASLGLLPGVRRAALLDEGEAVEGEVTLDDLAGGFRLGNAVRGLYRATLA